MTSTSTGRPWDLAAYLARHVFVPHLINSTWLDHSTGQRMIIRVVHEPGEEAHLISLTPNSICLYEILFSPDTPDDVIIAALETALSTA